jgi:hypothetical protein
VPDDADGDLDDDEADVGGQAESGRPDTASDGVRNVGRGDHYFR